jgi:uncharacterized membrane protein YkoI
MNRTSIVGALIASIAISPLSVAATTCSIHPAKDATDTQLVKMAKVSQSDAEKTALARAKGPARVLGSELQVKDDCLVWTLIVKENGKSAVKSFNVDAGTGKLMPPAHQTGKKESSGATTAK